MAEVLRSHYENFDVRIEKVGDSYRTRVSADSSGEGEAMADPSLALAQLDGFLFKVGQPRRRSRGQADVRLTEAKKFGAMLFESAFRGDALICLQKSLANTTARGVGMRIRLRLAGVPELSDLPWEFLYSEISKGFFSLSAYTPLVRYLDFPDSIRPLDVVSPLRILVVISSPTNYRQLDVEREWKTLKDTLADLEKKNLVVLERLDKPQLAALPRALRNGGFHILHFIGHGEFDDHGGALVFEDERQRGKSVSAERLGTVLHDQLSLRLVVLNACEGARSSRTDPFSGTAQTLVRQGIPAVLAMQFEITDDAAINFTSEFYSSVAVGDAIDAALADARLKLYALQDDEVEWATPVLHMRAPDGRIFELAQTGPVIDKQKERVITRSLEAAFRRYYTIVFLGVLCGLSSAIGYQFFSSTNATWFAPVWPAASLSVGIMVVIAIVFSISWRKATVIPILTYCAWQSAWLIVYLPRYSNVSFVILGGIAGYVGAFLLSLGLIGVLDSYTLARGRMLSMALDCVPLGLWGAIAFCPLFLSPSSKFGSIGLFVPWQVWYISTIYTTRHHNLRTATLFLSWLTISIALLLLIQYQTVLKLFQ